MQFSRILTYPKKVRPANLALVFRTLILSAGFYYLFLHIDQQQAMLEQIGNYQINWSLATLFVLVTVILLMPVNWLLEAKKWQILARKSNLGLSKALKGVILGVSLGTFMPFGTGAIAGRILSVEDTRRASYIPGVVIVQWLQTLVTISFGTIGITMVVAEGGADMFRFDRGSWLIILLLSVLVAILWHYLQPRLALFKQHFHSIREYSYHDWLKLTLLCVARYLTFLGQFTLLATAFSPLVPVRLVIGCATWMFVARTVVPRLSNIETLGIRGAAALYFCILFNISFPGILLSIVLLWVVNLFVPLRKDK